MLVPFAGKDPADVPFSTEFRGWDTPRRNETAYRRFRQGADTLQLAKKYGVQEQTVLRWITAERSKRLGLPNPYEKQA